MHLRQAGRIIYDRQRRRSALEVMTSQCTDTDRAVYQWTPSNPAEVIAFANHVRGLTDQNATLTLTDDPPDVVADVCRSQR